MPTHPPRCFFVFSEAGVSESLDFVLHLMVRGLKGLNFALHLLLFLDESLHLVLMVVLLLQ